MPELMAFQLMSIPRFIEKIKNKNKEKNQTIISTTNIVNIKENGFFMEFDDIKKHHLVKNGTT